MTDYYQKHLSGERLRRCYDLAPPRIRQYLQAEIEVVVSLLDRSCNLLELGCGYGRALLPLSEHFESVTGIDTSTDSLFLARKLTANFANCYLAPMDARRLAFADCSFDAVICIQNGLSAFHVDPKLLVREAKRVCRHGGIVVFTSYAEGIWNDRLHWFELQARQNLVGEIDYDRTGDGQIVCKDGFTATTFSLAGFRQLIEELDLHADIFEYDNSVVVCKIGL